MEKLKQIGKEILLFFTSKEVIKGLLKMTALVVVLLFVVFKSLKLYTNHGQKIEVEELIGMDLHDAQKLAEDRGFKVKIADSLFLVDRKPNEVVNQNPSAGSFVKENRTIYLTITKKSADMRKLPGLVGNYDYDQYVKKLKRLSIECSIKEKIYDGRQEQNSILYLVIDGKEVTQADLNAGVRVPMGSKIEAVVTYRYSETTDSPNLTCRTLDEVEFLLQSLDLKIGEILEDGEITDRQSAYIYQQSPEYQPGNLVIKDTPFTLYIRQTKSDNCQ